MRALWLLLGLVALAADGRADDQLALRNYQLGITLAEFKQIPYPDQVSRPGTDNLEVRTICNDGEPRPEGFGIAGLLLQPAESWKKIGVTVCRFYYRPPTKQVATWLEAGIEVADLGRLDAEFAFTPQSSDPANSQRLFSIRFEAPVADFPKLVSAYRIKYGQPSSSTNDRVQTTAGAKFDSQVLVWNRRGGKLTVTQRFATIDKSFVEYIEGRLNGQVGRLVEQLQKAAAKKL